MEHFKRIKNKRSKVEMSTACALLDGSCGINYCGKADKDDQQDHCVLDYCSTDNKGTCVNIWDVCAADICFSTDNAK